MLRVALHCRPNLKPLLLLALIFQPTRSSGYLEVLGFLTLTCPEFCVIGDYYRVRCCVREDFRLEIIVDLYALAHSCRNLNYGWETASERQTSEK